MAEDEARNLADRLYRMVLIVAAAVVFGLLFYWIAPDLTPYIGEGGAALWSWALIIFSGFAAHRLLPKTDLTPVSRVLIALLTSTVVAMLSAWISMLVVDLPIEQGETLDVLVMVGILALMFAGFVFVPIHLLRKKLGRAAAPVFVLAGLVIPASCIMVLRPLGPNEFVANLVFGVVLGLIGACSAITFTMITATRQAG